MKRSVKLGVWFCAPVVAIVVTTACMSGPMTKVAAGPIEGPGTGYRVLQPIQSGDLTLFPVVGWGGEGIGERSISNPG